MYTHDKMEKKNRGPEKKTDYNEPPEESLLLAQESEDEVTGDLERYQSSSNIHVWTLSKFKRIIVLICDGRETMFLTVFS